MGVPVTARNQARRQARHVSLRRRIVDSVLIPDRGEPARRRPADAIALSLSAVLLLATAVRINDPTRVELTFAEVINRLPDDLAGIAAFLYGSGSLWFVGLVVVVGVVARRHRLAATGLAAGITARLIGFVLLQVGGSRAASAELVVRSGSGHLYPTVRVAVFVAVLSAIGPHLTVLARRISWVVVAFAGIAVLYLGRGLPNDLLAGIALGFTTGAAAKLLFGSPAGRPSLDQVGTALDELGIEHRDLSYRSPQPHGVTVLTADGIDGALHIRAYGRDDRDAQLLGKAWRFAWYEESGPPLTFTRLQQVEHEAYVLLRAAQAQAPVPRLVAAATAGPGTAVLVERRAALTTLADRAGDIDDDVLDQCWRAIETLHHHDLAHGAVDLEHFVIDDGRGVEMIDFDAAATSATDAMIARDRAQLLASTALAVGADRAIAAARRALTVDELDGALPLLQLPALTDRVRHHYRRDRKALPGLRDTAATAIDREAPDLAPLARFNVRSAAMSAFTFLGVYLMLGQIASFSSLGDQLNNIQVSWLVFAVVAYTLTNIAFALAYVGATTAKVPFGSVVALQFAGSFTDLVTPNGVGTTAMNVRFLNVRGVPVPSAMASSLVNSVGSTIINVILLLAVLPSSGTDLDLGRIPWRGVVAVLLLAITVLAVVAAIVWRVPRFRSLYDRDVRPALAGVADVTHSPRKVALVLGGNGAVAILYALALMGACRAFGGDVGFASALFVNIVIGYIVGVVPVPGGVGVAEAGLAAGLTAIGVPSTTAVAAALLHRLITAWFPPLPGWFAMRYLEKEGDI